MFKREFKVNLKSLIIWTIILCIIYMLIFYIYPSLVNEETKESLTSIMSTMPQEILANFNMDIVGIETAYGWFYTEGYVFLILAGAMYSATLGGTILLKEESDKTIEFLYSKPVSRNKILNSKIICGIINIFIFTFIVGIVNYFFLYKIDGFDLKIFTMISSIPLLLYYMCFSIMIFASTFLRKTKKATVLATALVFGAYFFQIIGGMGEKINFLKKISIFEFASSRYIILNNGIDINYLIIGIGIIVLTLGGTYIKYNKKEFLL